MKAFKKKFKRDFFYYLMVVLRSFFNLFPYRAGYSFGVFLGKIAFMLPTKEKEKTLNNLRNAFKGEKSEQEIRRIAQDFFIHLGKTIAEWCLMEKIVKNLDEFISIEGEEKIAEYLKRGHGAIGIIAHFGNWELMGGCLAMRGYPVTVIARRVYYEKYNEALMRLRQRMKVRTIYRDGSVRDMLQVLRQGHILAIVGDQDVESVDGVFVNFFGRPAYTPVAPVRFAMASGAPIVPAFIVREGMKHKVIIGDEIFLENTGDKQKDLIVNTQKWVFAHENLIRNHPHLWVWNHSRWRQN